MPLADWWTIRFSKQHAGQPVTSPFIKLTTVNFPPRIGFASRCDDEDHLWHWEKKRVWRKKKGGIQFREQMQNKYSDQIRKCWNQDSNQFWAMAMLWTIPRWRLLGPVRSISGTGARGRPWAHPTYSAHWPQCGACLTFRFVHPIYSIRPVFRFNSCTFFPIYAHLLKWFPKQLKYSAVQTHRSTPIEKRSRVIKKWCGLTKMRFSRKCECLNCGCTTD